jgi:aryl-alcohol dehydrogenase-like predicted oxidoreductase
MADTVPAVAAAGRYSLGDRTVHRMGYGAMQLAGPGVFGPPRDRGEAIAVLRTAVDAGVNHIDTSDYYGPHVTNDVIREALHPYPDGLLIVTKLGARRDNKGNWLPWHAPADLVAGVEDNLRRLGLDRIEVVNLRAMFSPMGPAEGALDQEMETLVGLQQRGLVGHIGLSNVTARQVADCQKIAPIACVQNHYNFVHRGDDALIDALAEQGIAYTPFFPLGGFSPLQSSELSALSRDLGATPMQVALAWLLHRSPNVLLIPGTSSLVHLAANLAAAALVLPEDAIDRLNRIDSPAD